jgi:hypothetical protein
MQTYDSTVQKVATTWANEYAAGNDTVYVHTDVALLSWVYGVEEAKLDKDLHVAFSVLLEAEYKISL